MYRLTEPEPTRVLVIMRATSDNLRTHGHPWAATTPLVLKALLDAGFEVQLSNNLDRIKNLNNNEDGPSEEQEGSKGLPFFDVVIFHGKLEQSDDTAVQALTRFVEGGKGLVVIHIASASFAIAPDGSTKICDQWKELLGSIWVYGTSDHPEPPQAVTVNVTDPEHPIMAGIPSEFTLAKEELYLFDKMVKADSGAGHVLAEGTTFDVKQGVTVTEPVAFALERGKGRVFHIYLGHFISTHRDGRFQKIITQGVEWAARR